MKRFVCIFIILMVAMNLCGCIAVLGCGGLYGESENYPRTNGAENPVFGKKNGVDFSGKTIPLPAVMYHSVNNNNTGDYVVSPTELENDFRWIKDHGFTPVFVRDAVAYVRGKNDEVPEKPILITLDDGFFNNYT